MCDLSLGSYREGIQFVTGGDSLRLAPAQPAPVSQCSTYDDKRLPSKCDMEKIAWILLTKKTGRTIGFVTAKQFREIEGDDAEIIPAAAIDTTDTET